MLIAKETTNAAVPVGTFYHVSGAINTINIIVTASTTTQWYPPHTNYSMRVIADGKIIDDKAATLTADKIQFVESANICARADIIDAWKRDGGMPAGWEPDAVPSMAQTITYSYDRYGQLTIARDWLTLKNIPVADLMGLQAQRHADAIQYIVPGSLPFLYQGATIDYSMGVAADYTLASGISVNFNSAKLQTTGEYAHRVLVTYADSVFAIGLLPVGDAAYDVRRSRVSSNALEIRGNSGKLYFRVLDKGSHTSIKGDHYSAIGYRLALPKSTDRTAFYAVEGGGFTWIYSDWHNKAGLDRLPIDENYPELIGREFEIVEARNVTIKGGVIAGSLPILVDAGETSATLILKVKA